MATTPFSDDLVTKLAGATAWRFNSELGPVFTPRFFCCTDPNDLGITDGKAPVAVIELDPNPALVNEDVDYTGTASYDPDGSIASYAWTFESHSPSSGTVSAGTLNYSTAGTYTIQLTVTDGTDLQSTPAREELIVMEPIFAGYAATSSGVFFTNTEGTITWSDKNSGLSGDDLICWDVKIDPATQALPEANKAVWRANRGSILVSNDGGTTWGTATPGTVTNTWADDPAPVPGSVDWRQLQFLGERLFAIGTWQNGSSEWRSWLIYTDNVADMRADVSGSATWSEV
jgi:hypothetical protein